MVMRKNIYMDSMVPVVMNNNEEIRRIVREELNRRNRPASINCFERTQTLIRGAATAVSRNIDNRQTVSSSPAQILELPRNFARVTLLCIYCFLIWNKWKILVPYGNW